MGDSDAGAERSREAGRDAWNDLEGDSVLGQILHLFSAAAKEKRVAALETNNSLALPRFLNKKGVNVVLTRVMAGFLAHVDLFCREFGQGEDAIVNETVVDEDIGCANALDRAQCEEVGVAGTGAYQNHFPGPITARVRGRRSRFCSRRLICERHSTFSAQPQLWLAFYFFPYRERDLEKHGDE